MLPLSFREFLDFHGYTLGAEIAPAGGVKKRIMDADGEVYDARELYDAYTRFGGMPMLADIGWKSIGRSRLLWKAEFLQQLSMIY